MRRFCAVLSTPFSSTPIGIFRPTRNQLPFSRTLFFCGAKFAHFETEGSFGSQLVSPTLLAAEKEKAKAVLTSFLKRQSLSNALAAKTIKKSDLFINHLVSKLHSVHKSRYLKGKELMSGGKELTTLDIGDALNPYLESLLKEYGKVLVNVVESFPNPPNEEKPTLTVAVPASLPVPHSTNANKKRKVMSRVSEIGPVGKLRPPILYLIELGMDLEQIKKITRKHPCFAYYSLERKIKPLVEFFLRLGVLKSHIPTIFNKAPQLCGLRLSENLIPTMEYLESRGIDKKRWAKLIYHFPQILTISRQKVEANLEFLIEIGLSEEKISNIINRSPNIISYSVEDKLRPTAQYFCSLGVDVANLLYRSPQTFGLSIKAKLIPVTKFLLERGYSMEDVGTMISRFGALCTCSLVENLMPKWDFFLTMDYSASELVKFPQFFGYRLDGRIKPRYAIMKESGVKLFLSQMLTTSCEDFEEILKRKVEKMLSTNDPSELH